MTFNRYLSAICVLVLFPLSSEAAQAPNATKKFVQDCRVNLHCELSLFRELSKLLRPSGEEGPAAEYILQLKAVAEKSVWKKALRSTQDKIGNLVVYVPATGKFRGRNAPSMAIQSHMDMVLAHKAAKPGEDLRPYFKDGVNLVTEGDRIYSKDRASTIGADNGIGVAMALRYMLDDSLAHPPLELVFTVREEVGLAGAMAMEIPLESRQLINLDGMTYEPRSIIIASQGATRSLGNGELPAELEATGAARVRISIGNLAGGHSGGMIHLNRLNGVRGVAHILSHLQSQIKGLRIVSVVAGDGGALNKIPNSFSAEISLPAADATPSLLKGIEEKLRAMILQHVDDNLQGFTLSVERLAQAPAAPVLEARSGQELVSSILAAPNGLIEKDASFPNGILTSSNLGAFTIAPGAAGSFDVMVGSMSRSFQQFSLERTVREIQDKLKTAFHRNGGITFKDGGSYPSWQARADSPLLARALSLKQYFERTTPTTVGIEPSVFAARYPDMDIISFSARVQNAHTINEELSISSTRESVEALQALLAL